jgi:hypothetical protein
MMNTSDYPALAAAHAWSCAALGRLSDALAGLARDFPEVATVAASGSLGRREAGPHSDADLIVVLRDAVPDGRAAELMERLWDTLAAVGLQRPKPAGIYATPVTVADLGSTATLGQVAEDVPTFGKRMQLLLDARPVFDAEGSAAVQAAVLRRYAAGGVDRDPAAAWAYLLNDLVRYFRALRVRDQWHFSTGKGGWYLRSAKSEHSRVLMYAGFLLLLGEGSKGDADRVGALLRRLPLTPLERVAAVYADNGDPHFGRVAAAYDRFLALTADPEKRAEISAAAPASAADLRRPAPPVYEELMANASLLRRELVRFVLERRGDWGERFFEMLFF